MRLPHVLLVAFSLLACNEPSKTAAPAPGGSASPGAAPAKAMPGGSCQTGASAPCVDGCNTCQCTNGHWACTELACPR